MCLLALCVLIYLQIILHFILRVYGYRPLPRIPVDAYLDLPDVHRFLWQLFDEERSTVTACLPNLNLIAGSLRSQVCLAPLPFGLHRLCDLKKLLFEHAVMEPAAFGLAKRFDLALIIESNVHEQIFNLCKAATLTWSVSKGSNSYYADGLSGSFVLSVYDETERWSLGQCGVHPISGENYRKCKIIIFHKTKYE